MADAPDPITCAPRQPGQPYDATMPDGSMCGPWVKMTSGPCDDAGNVAGDFASGDRWQQC